MSDILDKEIKYKIQYRGSKEAEFQVKALAKNFLGPNPNEKRKRLLLELLDKDDIDLLEALGKEK